MKWIQRGMALCLSGALLFSLTAPAFAQETGEPSEKEEVVYTTLEADGSPRKYLCGQPFFRRDHYGLWKLYGGKAPKHRGSH